MDANITEHSRFNGFPHQASAKNASDGKPLKRLASLSRGEAPASRPVLMRGITSGATTVRCNTIDHRDFRADVLCMFNSTIPKSLKVAVAAGFISALAFSPLALAAEQGKENLDASASKEITGEVVDMMCYVDHNAMGDKHAGCAAKCIKGGGPVGIVSDGKAYLLVGQHKPMNDQLAEYAGKTITVKGKMAERGGVAMLENAEIVKK